MTELSQKPRTTSRKFILDLSPGKLLDIQFTNPLPIRFKLPLVGYESGKYLILKYPSHTNTNEYNDILKEGNGAIVRYIVEGERGECVAFSTTLIAVSFRPEKLLFLAYPKSIESRQLREVNRLQTHLPAKISISSELLSNNNNLIQGLITDISPSGCRFSIHVKTGFLALKKRKVFVHIISPIDNQPVIISAFVRNNQLHDDRLNVGIEFCGSEKVIIEELLTAYAINSV